ncbi:MAG TPA: hypothetical protein VFD60_12835 [Nitrososphaeraceae archaeon]|jgi:hypothetical protein|nr:hypothetical protein [Nitrososphaeraceae archaeon]
MADQLFMYAITAGVFAAFAAVLFTARAKRYRSKSIASEEQRSSPI